ncbi:unnamed protein product, partial [Polarella glacialis]
IRASQPALCSRRRWREEPSCSTAVGLLRDFGLSSQAAVDAESCRVILRAVSSGSTGPWKSQSSSASAGLSAPGTVTAALCRDALQALLSPLKRGWR